MWAYALAYVLASIYYVAFIWGGGAVAWLLGMALVHRLMRGSELAWIAAVVLSAVYLVISAVEVQMATAPGGHSPMVHLIEASFVVVMLAFLLVPPSRTFVTS